VSRVIDIIPGEKSFELCERITSEATGKLLRYVGNVADMAKGLAQEPIMVPTGQLEPIPGTPRSYSDVRAEIVSELVHQDDHYARGIIIGSMGTRLEVAFKTVGLRPVEDAHKAQLQVDAARDMTREYYTTQRSAVYEEIERRQTTVQPSSKAPIKKVVAPRSGATSRTVELT
jgi:hypothetical protein